MKTKGRPEGQLTVAAMREGTGAPSEAEASKPAYERAGWLQRNKQANVRRRRVLWLLLPLKLALGVVAERAMAAGRDERQGERASCRATARVSLQPRTVELRVNLALRRLFDSAGKAPSPVTCLSTSPCFCLPDRLPRRCRLCWTSSNRHSTSSLAVSAS